MTEAERIAAGLSEAQRAAITHEPEWSMMLQYYAGILEPVRLGVIEPDAWGHKLTPLGLEVRRILQEQANGE